MKGDYHSKEALLTEFDALCYKYPNLMKRESIGKTVEGNNIFVYYMGEGNSKILIDSAMHGLEIVNSELLLLYAEWVLQKKEEGIANLVLKRNTALIPIIDYDNYHKGRKNINGVDLNRNFPICWGLKGSSSDPKNRNYHGPTPLSEPESKAIYDFWNAYHPQIYINLHAGQYGIYSNMLDGYTESIIKDLYIKYVNFSLIRNQIPWTLGVTRFCGEAITTISVIGAIGLILETIPQEPNPPPSLQEVEDILFPRWLPFILAMTSDLTRLRDRRQFGDYGKYVV